MSSKKEPNMFVFAGIICVVCSVLLTAAATGLKSLQDENVRIDKQKNILKAVGVLTDGQVVTKEKVASLYETKIKNRWVTAAGKLLEASSSESDRQVFLYEEGVSLVAYAVPVSGYGLWSTIYGFLAIEGDGETVAGLTVYQHGETPGLGGECEKPWFQNQFVGKKIVDQDGKFVSVGIVKGKVADTVPENKHQYYVDGMSGATITSKGMEDFIKADLTYYEPFAKTLR